ncbi:HpcH/HpaI aldolase/citrate lyase family protein [Trinickia diaoshuihuensis]|uniref:HpcH/HpaI aldolase/citrate lyase family protein n=1 Tax=Trinickia diaoshuihuensis TaxID=2292265 RepID=UPI000E245E1F|nr:CoA ester lyase [Trinickia diaoshuihuensis]
MNEGLSFAPWRSLLYVPAHISRYADSACRSSADAALLDLEDSVPPESKHDARAMLPASAHRIAAAGLAVLVRVNAPLRWMVDDLRAAVGAGVTGVVVPKVLGASHLMAIDECLEMLELEHGRERGATRLIATIETPQAFGCMDRIARASPRLVGMMLGGGDFAVTCGSHANANVLRVPKQLLVIAAAAAGVWPLGLMGTPDDLGDLEGFERMARESAEFGFVGATCIHPKQVGALNRAFSPSEAEVARARRIVDAYAAARGAGRGAAAFEGKMIDLPVLAQARRIIERDAALRQRSGGAA